MKKLTAVAGIIAVGTFVSAASAADMPTKARIAPAPVAYNWTGCFVGGNIGGIFAHDSWNVASGDPSIGVAGIVAGTPFGSRDANSWLGGGQVGCDYQFATSYVIGIQGDYDWTNAKGTGADAVNNAFFATTGWTDQTRVKSLGSVTARGGYAWDRFLAYVRGGVAFERNDYTIFNPAGVASATASSNRTGWTVGVGGEYAITSYLSGFVEYDYYDFGTRSSTFNAPAGALFDIADIRDRKSVVKGGLNLRWHP